MRIVIVVVLLLAAPARADVDVGGFVGLGFGPARIAGELGERFTGAGATGQMRMGFRVERAGLELRVAFMGLDDSAGLDAPVLVTVTPLVTGYLVQRRYIQLLAHAGLGFSTLGGTRMAQVACVPPEECLTRLETESITYPGIALDGGLTAQVHFGRKTNHAMLWIDVAGSLHRHRVDDVIQTGRTTGLVIGIADAF
ncbi:MAG: hypothetical protein ABI867_13895 [Kofleriaceae bacterium]